MEEQNNNIPQEEEYKIDWMALINTLLSKWKTLAIVGAVTFVVAAALQLCIPNHYATTVKLSPEVAGKSGGGGGLASLASSMGFDISSAMNGNSSNALYPTMYPDVVGSPDFAVGLFNVQVRTKDGRFEGSYYDYLTENQNGPFWSKGMAAVGKGIGKLISLMLPKKEEEEGTAKAADSRHLTYKQAMMVKTINKKISCDADKKLGLITLHIADQDQLVCGILADSVKAHLEDFITDYQTRKAIIDREYYLNLMDSAKIAYEEASRRYYSYAEEHAGLSLERYKIKKQDLQTEMNFQQNVYSSFQKQYLAAEAKVQESKPAFISIQAPAIPAIKAGPSRAKNVLMFTFLALVIASVVLVRKQIDWKALIGM